MLLLELGREHAADRGIEHRPHAAGGYFFGHAAERRARGLGEDGEGVGYDQPAKAPAVVDRKLERDEGAEAVAEHVRLARQIERVHDAGDVVGVISNRLKRDGR